MASIIENQHVAKRCKASSFRSNNKSAGFTSGFMSHFNQNPARSGKKSHSFTAFTKQPRFQKKAPASAAGKRPRQQDKPQKARGSGFSFNIPSFATLAVIAATVFVALAALKWDDLNINLPDDYAFETGSKTEAEKRTRRYAATGISSIMVADTPPETDVIAPVAEPPEEKTAIAAVTQAPAVEPGENHDKLLVTFEWQQYKVKKGDSVSVIAKEYGVSIGAIIASNEITNARRLQEGATIRIPNIDGIPYIIKNGDNLHKISASFNVPLEVILDVNDLKSDKIKAGETLFIPGARMNDMDLRMSLGELFICPVQKKYITDYYGMRKDPINGQLAFHTGVDFMANIGTIVMAAMDGTAAVVSENWLYGKHIILSHGNGYKTLYAHLNSFSIKKGDKVARGRKIGETGNTGYSTGPHLHFGIYDKNGKTVNPLDMLN